MLYDLTFHLSYISLSNYPCNLHHQDFSYAYMYHVIQSYPKPSVPLAT